MDLLEKINRSFGAWYEGLFGGSDDVRPRDILRRILTAMESGRKEGFDNNIYVPNQYILEINVHDDEEKEYLLSFLNKDELEAAIRRYCQQNNYHIRGVLDFTIREVEPTEGSPDRKGEKVRVKCRYDSKITSPAVDAPLDSPVTTRVHVEDRTVVSVRAEQELEDGTVPTPSAALVVYAPDRSPYRFELAGDSVSIGRSPGAGNNLVIDSDGQISKRHARIEREADGRFTIYDLGSTNGTKVNGKRIDNRSINDGDELVIGTTKLTFQQYRTGADNVDVDDRSAPSSSRVQYRGVYGGAAARDFSGNGSSSPPQRLLHTRSARLVLTDSQRDVDDFLLASETWIGRGVTNDIVLPDRSVATRHARFSYDGDTYRVEALSEGFATSVNETPLVIRNPVAVSDGDRIAIGVLILRFEAGR